MIAKLKILLMTGGMLALLASCSRRSFPGEDPRGVGGPRNDRGVYDPYPGNLPPGQAKKVYGDRSARNHAPGHCKKTVVRRPVAVIIIDDRYARQDRYGAWYYDDKDNYRYWKRPDGRYYLDERYRFSDDDHRDCNGCNAQRNRNNDDDRYDRDRRDERYDRDDKNERKRNKHKHKNKRHGKRYDDDDDH
jgi:hypothetical protein